MSGTLPVALYAAIVPTGGILVPATLPGASAMFRVTMAAISPDAEPEYEDEAHASKPPRSTLWIIRAPAGLEDFDDDEDDEDDEEDSEDDEVNGGPSDPSKKMKALAAQLKQLEEEEGSGDDDDEGSDDDNSESLAALISKMVKGKGKALDDDEGSESSEGIEEVVVCTLDPEKHYQQSLDFVVGAEERVFFKVTGTHTVYLSGNYVIPIEEFGGRDSDSDSEDDEDEDDYDLSPDEDELALMGEDDESDILDDMVDPRVMEIDSEEEETLKGGEKTKAIKKDKKDKKGKNKRAAEDSDGEKDLDDIISKSLQSEPPLSKKQQKKLKKNNGEGVDVESAPKSEKADKKVQFAKQLEQGPTGSTAKKPDGTTGTLGVKNVQGVTVDDRKLGKGPAVKKGSRVSMRYIGKLENGKVFDSNKSGKPFSFKVGAGEVIKGWEVGLPGMAVGGERRITVPASMAYGKQKLPGIPPNSTLIFDLKLLEIK
ncbi:peptidylprolyl isomerase fpr4 [Myotisia sp. PD_48]|nr:peptidylprolyl isomerase fpr4 [Myotisia sp. PD_48]